MCLCFETIKCVDGELQNISYHQNRFDKTRFELFEDRKNIDLEDAIQIPKDGVFRIKVIYDSKIQKVEILAYEDKRSFKSFVLKNADFDYRYKFLERRDLDTKDEEFDEVLFVKDDLLTDTSIANVALLIDGIWKTPKRPLLKGTMRAHLLDKELLIEDNLGINSLKIAQKFAIMNALIGFKILDNIKIEERI